MFKSHSFVYCRLSSLVYTNHLFFQFHLINPSTKQNACNQTFNSHDSKSSFFSSLIFISIITVRIRWNFKEQSVLIDAYFFFKKIKIFQFSNLNTRQINSSSSLKRATSTTSSSNENESTASSENNPITIEKRSTWSETIQKRRTQHILERRKKNSKIFNILNNQFFH